MPAVSKRLPLHQLLVQQRIPVEVYWHPSGHPLFRSAVATALIDS